MNIKRPVYRTCSVTREKLLKKDLFRIVKTKSGEVKVDIDQNIQGRGVYIKKDLKTIESAYQKKALNRALRCMVKEDIYLSLIQALSKKGRD